MQMAERDSQDWRMEGLRAELAAASAIQESADAMFLNAADLVSMTKRMEQAESEQINEKWEILTAGR